MKIRLIPCNFRDQNQKQNVEAIYRGGNLGSMERKDFVIHTCGTKETGCLPQVFMSSLSPEVYKPRIGGHFDAVGW